MMMNLSNIGHNFLRYDGVNLSDFFVVRKIDMPLLPNIEASGIKIDGRAGEWFAKREINTRDIIVGLGILNDTKERKDILENWFLLSDKIAKDKVCKLEIGNGRFVNAILMGDSPITTNREWSTVDVTFRCFDPYIYGEEHTESLKAGNNTIRVKGKYPTYPTIELTGATAITLTHNGTGDKVHVTGLTASQKLLINMAEYKCSVNGVYKPADPTVTDFWPLTPGDNVLNLSSGSGTLKYREMFL